MATIWYPEKLRGMIQGTKLRKILLNIKTDDYLPTLIIAVEKNRELISLAEFDNLLQDELFWTQTRWWLETDNWEYQNSIAYLYTQDGKPAEFLMEIVFKFYVGDGYDG